MQTQQLSQRPVLGVCALAFSLAALTVHAPSAKAGFCVIAANTGGTQPLYVDGTAGTQTLYVGGAAGGRRSSARAVSPGSGPIQIARRGASCACTRTSTFASTARHPPSR